MLRHRPASIMMSPRENAYRGAIILNNMGVSLLEKHAYFQAMATFRDAVGMIKFVLAPDLEDENARPGFGSESSQSMQISDKVNESAKRLATPESMNSDMQILQILYDGGRMMLPSTDLFETPSTVSISNCKLYPIRIDLDDCSSPCTQRDIDLEAAMLLHNFSLAHTGATFIKTNKVGSKGSLRLLEMSYRILKYTAEDEWENHPFVESRLCMALLVLTQLVPLLFRMDKQCRAEEFQALAAQLLCFFRETSTFFCNSLTAAAA